MERSIKSDRNPKIIMYLFIYHKWDMIFGHWKSNRYSSYSDYIDASAVLLENKERHVFNIVTNEDIEDVIADF